jgi:hypothetical protein
LEEKIYSKLAYYRKEWYEYYGVDFVFNEEAYRIINKVSALISSNITPTSPSAMALNSSLTLS